MEIVVPEEFQYLYVQSKERPVVKIPHPILRQTATEVTELSKKIDKLVLEMSRILKLANGVGLAAPQVGVGKRLILVAPEGYKMMALLNPIITSSEGEQIGQEGCLSIPGLYGDVKRALKIEVNANDAKGNPVTLELEGMPARIVQHEFDHLDGVLFIDKVDVATLHWAHPGSPDDATAE